MSPLPRTTGEGNVTFSPFVNLIPVICDSCLTKTPKWTSFLLCLCIAFRSVLAFHFAAGTPCTGSGVCSCESTLSAFPCIRLSFAHNCMGLVLTPLPTRLRRILSRRQLIYYHRQRLLRSFWDLCRQRCDLYRRRAMLPLLWLYLWCVRGTRCSVQ